MSVSNRPAVVREYTRRLNLALDYIRDHLDGELTVESVSRAALFSPFHFHRLFGAMTGETLYNHIRRVRLEKAANLLLQSPCRPITDIALDVGFGSPSSFARAFRGHFGASATRWRADGGGRKSKKRKTNSKAGKAAAAAFPALLFVLRFLLFLPPPSARHRVALAPKWPRNARAKEEGDPKPTSSAISVIGRQGDWRSRFAAFSSRTRRMWL